MEMPAALYMAMVVPWTGKRTLSAKTGHTWAVVSQVAERLAKGWASEPYSEILLSRCWLDGMAGVDELSPPKPSLDGLLKLISLEAKSELVGPGSNFET